MKKKYEMQNKLLFDRCYSLSKLEPHRLIDAMLSGWEKLPAVRHAGGRCLILIAHDGAPTDARRLSRTDRCILAVDIVLCLRQLAGNIEILIEYR